MASASARANERALRASLLFGRFDEKLVATLADLAVRKQFARREHLWRSGTQATHFHVITSGLVEILRRGADGTDAIVAIFGPRESIGDTAVLARGAYPADAVAASDAVEVLLIEASPVLSAMQSDAQVAQSLNAALLDHTRALQEKIRIMTAGSVPKRLATLLLHLCERFGDEGETGATTVPVPLTRGELAHLVGATVETTIRTMSRWQKLDVVRTSRDGFEIADVARLEAIATTDVDDG